MNKLNIIYKSTDELIPYAKNPRHNQRAIEPVATSIEAFGFKVPVIIDEKNEIVAGHTRVAAAKKLNIKAIPCIVADDLSEEQVKAFRLADNRAAEFASWNQDLLLEELDDLKDVSIEIQEALSVLEFDDDYFDESLLDDLFAEAEVREDDSLKDEDEEKTIQCPKCNETIRM